MIKASRWLTNQNLGYVSLFCIVDYEVQTYLMHWQDGNGVPSNEYFYNLKNVTFCGFHPRDHRYFGFITKVRDHTCDVSRVTCHVSCCSTPARVGSGTPATCSWASRARGAWPRPTGESSLTTMVTYRDDDADTLLQESLQTLLPEVYRDSFPHGGYLSGVGALSATELVPCQWCRCQMGIAFSS